MELSWMDKLARSLLISIYNLTRRWSFLWPRILRNPILSSRNFPVESKRAGVLSMALISVSSILPVCTLLFEYLYRVKVIMDESVIRTRGCRGWKCIVEADRRLSLMMNRVVLVHDQQSSFSNHPCDPLFHEVSCSSFPFRRGGSEYFSTSPLLNVSFDRSLCTLPSNIYVT